MKKSELRKLIKETIKKLITEEKFSVLNQDGMNNFCLGCSACCGVTDTESFLGVVTHVHLECMNCPGGMPVGTVFDINGNPLGAPGKNPDKAFAQIAGDNTPNKPPMIRKSTRRDMMKENAQLLNEAEIVCDSLGMIKACIQFVSDCLAGGEYPCTNPAQNTANGYITVYCGCGGLPTEVPFDSLSSYKQYSQAFEAGEAVGGDKGDPLGLKRDPQRDRMQKLAKIYKKSKK